jgi:hypothetical protein
MLSIRTQDRKTLVPYSGAILAYLNVLWLQRFQDEDTDIKLGTYSSQERALEVLDEIQVAVIGKILIPTQRFEIDEILTVGTSNPYVEINETKIETLPTVYEMPKE